MRESQVHGSSTCDGKRETRTELGDTSPMITTTRGTSCGDLFGTYFQHCIILFTRIVLRIPTEHRERVGFRVKTIEVHPGPAGATKRCREYSMLRGRISCQRLPSCVRTGVDVPQHWPAISARRRPRTNRSLRCIFQQSNSNREYRVVSNGIPVRCPLCSITVW